MAVAAATALSAQRTAVAVQYLIAPGESWQERAARLRPGDELILMPGKHKPGGVDVLEGTAANPIIIRGVDPEHPGEIVAEREGIRFREVRHVVIRDLIISGGSINGMTLGGDNSAVDRGPNNVTIKGVTVRGVGPRGQRHGIACMGLSVVRIEDCRFEGWGGAAVDFAACKDVKVIGCTMKGLDDYGQLFGVRVRAGTSEALIERCKFDNAGKIALCLGAASNFDDFLPPLSPEAAPGSVFEAAYVNVEQCVIVDSLCAVVYDHSRDCAVQRNTIVRPRQTVIALLAEQTDPRFSAGHNNIFRGNIVEWEPGDLKSFAEVAATADGKSFFMFPNLWWSSQSLEERVKLEPVSSTQPGAPMIPGSRTEEQILDIDPKLNSRHMPTNEQAVAFGAAID
jgi:hypothetical protein